jgi:hypothetical protein
VVGADYNLALAPKSASAKDFQPRSNCKDRISSQLKLTSSSAAGGTNPLHSAGGTDNALRLLLAKSNDVSTEAVEAACTELLGRQKAVVAAMKSTLADNNLTGSEDGDVPERCDKEFVRAFQLEIAN